VPDQEDVVTELTPDLLARYENLTRNARGLRTVRRPSGPQVLLVVGAVATAVGLLLVALGWLGASHTILVFEQIPYLISGGIFGGCLVVAGSVAYFAYWVTKVDQQSRRAADSLERMEELMRELLERTAS
jgi:hypothetical protein